MVSLGYALSREEHGPAELVDLARRAEEAGFEFAMISDHFHPWTERQGQSAFVWSVIGAIAERTERIALRTGVTCPTMRIHPAIVAQARRPPGTRPARELDELKTAAPAQPWPDAVRNAVSSEATSSGRSSARK